MILLRSLRFYKYIVAVKINNIQGIELAVSFNVTWPDKVHLMNVVATKRLSKVRILNTFGNIYSFF